jgi:predicted kinase
MSRLILVRGMPGSGKSTLAAKIAAIEYYNHLETDQYWMVDGEYKFDMSRIKDAHQWCQDSVREKLTKGYGVVVSNTFTTQKEMKPYFDMAKEFGIRPQVILCQGNYGNIHNVPTDVLARMAERFEYDLFELWIGLDL